MKRLLYVLLASVALVLPCAANATVHVVTGTTITVFANNRSADAHLIASSSNILWNGSTFVASPDCGNYIYIAQADKEIFALALTAVASGKTVSIAWDDAAPSAGAYWGTYTCKVISIYVS